MSLPKDPFMLLSYVNTQLRDNFSSLSELCSSLGVSEEDIVGTHRQTAGALCIAVVRQTIHHHKRRPLRQQLQYGNALEIHHV